jgi:hypothetical protein
VIAKEISSFPPKSRNSTNLRVSPTSLFVARIAEAPRRPAWMAADAEEAVAEEEDSMVVVVVAGTAEAP